MTKKPKLFIVLIIAALPVLLAFLINFVINAQSEFFRRYDLTVTLPYELRRGVEFADESELDENEIAQLDDRDGNRLCSIIRAAADSELPDGDGEDKNDWFAVDGEYTYALVVPDSGAADDYIVLKAYFIAANDLEIYDTELESSKQQLEAANQEISYRETMLNISQNQIKTARTYLKAFKK